MSGKLRYKVSNRSTRLPGEAYAVCRITGRHVDWRGEKNKLGSTFKRIVNIIELDYQASLNESSLQTIKANLSRLMNANYHS